MLVRVVNEKDRILLDAIAKKVLEPLYGDQSKAMHEWFSGDGYKNAFVAEVPEGGSVAAFLCLKANPRKDFLKISTFFVLEDYRKKGFSKKLLCFAESFAELNGFKEMVVTVSEGIDTSIAFFQKSGFTVMDSVCGKYRQGVTEYVLKKVLA